MATLSQNAKVRILGSSGPKGPEGGGGPPRTDREEGVAVKERAVTKKPPMYKVLIHNDDYTTKEFVVLVLEAVFHKSEIEATQVMEHIHRNGVGVAGVYAFQVAETKLAKTMSLAKRYEYPLQLSMEPEN